MPELPAHRAAPERDLVLDLLRALCVIAVAVGHWLVVVPTLTDGRLDGHNALADVWLMQPLTWVFQVMPLFFVVGGAAHTYAWRRARERGSSPQEWGLGRLQRLMRPTIVLVVAWAVALTALRAAGTDGQLLDRLGWLPFFPLWFLAVYVLIVAAAPRLIAADERWGWRVWWALAGAAGVVDGLRFADPGAPLRFANFAFVFGACHALGTRLAAGAVDRRVALRLTAGGATFLAIAVGIGPYPLAMVGVPGDQLANNAPPTLCLLALGLVQIGAATLLRAELERLLERRSVVAAVAALNLRAMSIFLWHVTALAVAGAAILTFLDASPPVSGTASWWLQRMAWLPLVAIVLAAIVTAIGAFERSQPTTRAIPRGVFGLAVGLLAAGLGRLTTGGITSPSGGLDLVTLGLVVAPAWWAVRGTRPDRVRPAGAAGSGRVRRGR